MSIWTDENEALLRVRYAGGYSASVIAREIAKRTGGPVSRNAVIGKIHRLGLSRDPNYRKAQIDPARIAVAQRKQLKRGPRGALIWTAEMVALARRHWMAGETSAYVSGMLKAELGIAVSASSVVSKMGREGLSRLTGKGTATVGENAIKSAQMRANGQVKDARARAFELPQGQAGVPLMDLEPHHCRWPLDGPDGAVLFCGAPKRSGKSYCAEHARRAKGKPWGAACKSDRPVIAGGNRPALMFGRG
jgi:hypothetical protein